MAAVGGAKMAISKAVNYAKERKQFRVRTTFKGIKPQNSRCGNPYFASSRLQYRAGQNIDDFYAAMVAEAWSPQKQN